MKRIWQGIFLGGMISASGLGFIAQPVAAQAICDKEADAFNPACMQIIAAAEIDPTQQQAIWNAVLQADDLPKLALPMHISAFRADGDWFEATVVSDSVIEGGWEDIDESDIRTVIAQQKMGVWDAGMLGSTSGQELGLQVPETFWESSDTTISDTNRDQAINYLFPWTAGHRWYRTGGWHGWEGRSLDFSPYYANDVSVDFAVLSIERGTLRQTCNDGVQVNLSVTHPNGAVSHYAHLDARAVRSDLRGRWIERGQIIGYLYRNGTSGKGGAYSTACGRGTAAHLHLTLPSRDVPINGIWANTVSANAGLYTSSNTRIDNLVREIAQHSNLCMDIAWASLANGGVLQQWGCNGGGNQIWIEQWVGGGYYRLINWNSRKCLDVYGASTSYGANVVQWDCHGGANQRFRKEFSGSIYRFRAQHSGLCFDVAGVSPLYGARIIQWGCHTGLNQYWSPNFRAMTAAEKADANLETVIPMKAALVDHTLYEGDTVEQVLSVYGITAEALLAANPEFASLTEIQPGTRIQVPVQIPANVEFNRNRTYLPLLMN